VHAPSAMRLMRRGHVYYVTAAIKCFGRSGRNRVGRGACERRKSGLAARGESSGNREDLADRRRDDRTIAGYQRRCADRGPDRAFVQAQLHTGIVVHVVMARPVSMRGIEPTGWQPIGTDRQPESGRQRNRHIPGRTEQMHEHGQQCESGRHSLRRSLVFDGPHGARKSIRNHGLHQSGPSPQTESALQPRLEGDSVGRSKPERTGRFLAAALALELGLGAVAVALSLALGLAPWRETPQPQHLETPRREPMRNHAGYGSSRSTWRPARVAVALPMRYRSINKPIITNRFQSLPIRRLLDRVRRKRTCLYVIRMRDGAKRRRCGVWGRRS